MPTLAVRVTNDYAEKLSIGSAYETYVLMRLQQKGIKANPVIGKYDQLIIGDIITDSHGIWEVKFDQRFHQTGNLYFEIAEKSDPSNPEYIRSGVFREDQSTIFAIGDYRILFIFDKSDLQKRLRAITSRVSTSTSIGILVPEHQGHEWSKRVWTWVDVAPLEGTALTSDMVNW